MMPKVTLNDLARALKNLETEVRKRRNYITVNEMLDLAEGAGASEHGRLKSDVLSTLSPSCDDLYAHSVQSQLEGFYWRHF